MRSALIKDDIKCDCVGWHDQLSPFSSSSATSLQFMNIPAPSSSDPSLSPQLSPQLFLFYRESNLKFVIYDVVSLSWAEKPLVISHDDANVIISKANKQKKKITLMQFLKKGQALPILSLFLISTYFRLTVQGY